MARNWDTASRGGLTELVDAYYGGLDQGQMRRLRENADREKTSRYATEQGYVRPKYDGGNFQGYERDTENYRRDKKYKGAADKMIFGNPKDSFNNPANAPQPQAETDFTKLPNRQTMPSGRPMGKTEEDYAAEAAGRAPQSDPSKPEMAPGDPKPLLRDPKLASQNQQAKMQTWVDSQGKPQKVMTTEGVAKMHVSGDPEEKAAQFEGQDPATGKKQRFVGADRTEMNPYGDAAVDTATGKVVPPSAGQGLPPRAAEAPAASAIADEEDPSPFMMHRLGEMVTTPRAAKAAALDPLVNIAELPLPLQRRLRAEGLQGQVPTSILKAWLTGELGIGREEIKEKGKLLDQDAEEILPLIQDGALSYGEAALTYRKRTGQTPSKAVMDAFKTAGGFGERGKDRDQRKEQQDKGKYLAIVSDATKEFNDAYKDLKEQLHYASQAKRLANMKDTKGVKGAVGNMLARASGEKGPLSNQDVTRFGGSEGLFDSMDRWLTAKVDEEGMTPADIAIVNKLADEFIKAGNEKSKMAMKPIIGRLRTRATSYFGPDGANEAETLFNQEMMPTVDYEGEEEAPKKPAAGAAQKSQDTSGKREPQGKFKQTPNEAKFLKLQQTMTEAMRRIDASQSMSNAEKISRRRKLKARFFEDSAKLNGGKGIKWDSKED